MTEHGKAGEPSWQGTTHAEWHRPVGPAAPGTGGSLKAVTTGLKPGYLRKNGAHRMGWFSSRKVTSLGQGTTLPPETERESLPPARVEVVVFVPQT